MKGFDDRGQMGLEQRGQGVSELSPAPLHHPGKSTFTVGQLCGSVSCHRVSAYQWFPACEKYLHLKKTCTRIISFNSPSKPVK